MSQLANALRKALASLAASALPHENPAPQAGTSIAHVQPAPPAPSTSFKAIEKANVKAQLDVLRDLERVKPTKSDERAGRLSQADRAAIIHSLNRFGPPRDSWTSINFPASKPPEPKVVQEVLDKDRAERQPMNALQAQACGICGASMTRVEEEDSKQWVCDFCGHKTTTIVLGGS